MNQGLAGFEQCVCNIGDGYWVGLSTILEFQAINLKVIFLQLKLQ